MKKSYLLITLALLSGTLSFGQQALHRIMVDSKYGYGYENLDHTDAIVVITAKYDDAEEFHEGLACVQLDGKWQYIDNKGEVKFSTKFDAATSYSNGMASVGMYGSDGKIKYGFIDKSGALVIPYKYDQTGWFGDEVVGVVLGGKCGFINKSGVLVCPFKYDTYAPFVEGYASVALNNKWGFVNSKGKEVVPLKYDGAGNFSDGLATVRLNNKYGYVDGTGKEVIPLQYDGVWPFDGGYGKVNIGTDATEAIETWSIDKTGKKIELLNKLVNHPKFVFHMDSVTYTGTVNGKRAWLRFTCQHSSVQKIWINNVLVPEKQLYRNSEEASIPDLSKLNLKAGDKVTVKVVFMKGNPVEMESGGGVDVPANK